MALGSAGASGKLTRYSFPIPSLSSRLVLVIIVCLWPSSGNQLGMPFPGRLPTMPNEVFFSDIRPHEQPTAQRADRIPALCLGAAAVPGAGFVFSARPFVQQ